MKKMKVPKPKDKKKYPIWVRVRIPVTKAELIYCSGRKCRDYERGCAVCRSWASWEKTGKINALVERRELLGIE